MDVTTDSMWGLCGVGMFVYEGCNFLLFDGNMCTLGPSLHQEREMNPESPIRRYSRKHHDHVYVKVGHGWYMYNFAIAIGDMVLQVWELNGLQLFGISGAEFHSLCSSDEG